MLPPSAAVLTQTPTLSADSGISTPAARRPLKSGKADWPRRSGVSSSVKSFPGGAKSARNQAVSGKVAGFTANNPAERPGIPSSKVTLSRNTGLKARTAGRARKLSAISRVGATTVTTKSPPARNRACSCWLRVKVDWKAAPNTPRAAANISSAARAA